MREELNWTDHGTTSTKSRLLNNKICDAFWCHWPDSQSSQRDSERIHLRLVIATDPPADSANSGKECELLQFQFFSSLHFSSLLHKKIPTTSKWRENAQPQPGNGLTLLAGLYLIDNSVETTSSTQYSQTRINKTSLNRCSIMQVTTTTNEGCIPPAALHWWFCFCPCVVVVEILSTKQHRHTLTRECTSLLQPRRAVASCSVNTMHTIYKKTRWVSQEDAPRHIPIREEMHFVLVFYRILTPTGSHLYIR